MMIRKNTEVLSLLRSQRSSEQPRQKHVTLVGQKLQTSNIDVSKANWIH
jgi:hypothetical protein